MCLIFSATINMVIVVRWASDLSGLVEDISSEGWQNMKPNRQVMVILRSEIWYFSSKIQNLEHPITLSVNWLEIARLLGKSTKSAPKSRKINFLHNILSFPGFREVLDSIYVVHKCVGCFYTIATNFGFLVYTTFLYKSLVPVTLTTGVTLNYRGSARLTRH